MNSHGNGLCQSEAVPYVFLTFTHSEFKTKLVNLIMKFIILTLEQELKAGA